MTDTATINDRPGQQHAIVTPQLSCDGCGVCCLHMAVPPFDTSEIDMLPAEILEDFEAVSETRRLQYAAHGTDYTPCGWLNMVTRQCRHYEHRPEVCRDFEVGSTPCVGMRTDAGFAV